jgi:hypothetical protein
MAGASVLRPRNKPHGGFPMANRSTTTIDEPATDIGSSESTNPLADTGQQATERVSALAERAGDIGFQQADRGLNQAAEGVDSVAQTIRRVSSEMQTDQPQIANVAQTAADQAEALARYLRETDARQIISSVEGAARRQPILFLGGAFVLGLAASRFLKAATGNQNLPVERQRSMYGGSSYGSTGYGSTGYGSTGYGSTGSSGYGSSAGSFEATGPGIGSSNGLADSDEGI